MTMTPHGRNGMLLTKNKKRHFRFRWAPRENYNQVFIFNPYLFMCYCRSCLVQGMAPAIAHAVGQEHG